MTDIQDQHIPRQRPATIDHRGTLFREATKIVEAEFATDLSLDQVARRVATSRRQLQRAYAEIGETSFRTQLTRVRMHRAAELLRRERLPIREIAERVGYRQPAQFAKAFRRELGTAPSTYRARARDDDEAPPFVGEHALQQQRAAA